MILFAEMRHDYEEVYEMKNRLEKEAILTRKSIRTYTGEELSAPDKDKILNYINNEENLIGIHGNKIKIQLIEVAGKMSSKIGTYGIIKNAPAFLVVICKNNQDSLFDCGYVFERLILYLEQNGLGSCWLGGTFNRAKVVEKISLSQDEIISAISPVGYSEKKRAIGDKLIRSLAKGDSRLDVNKLFHCELFNRELTNREWKEKLEMVRLAPSASNKQPWRILMDESGDAHFYLERTPKYSESLSYDIQWLDMGISASHYEIACEGCEFFVDTSKSVDGDHDLEYVITARNRV